MKAYKGFDIGMTCRNFQYEEGKTYEEDEARCCETGFHACENPIGCLHYYGPNSSEYHEVECEGKLIVMIDLVTIVNLHAQKLRLGEK